MTDIQKAAYERYRLQWMLNHGYSLTHLLNELTKSISSVKNGVTLKDIFDNWEDYSGFNGEIGACFDEFYCNEYQDECYMKTLLSDDEWKIYLEDKELYDE